MGGGHGVRGPGAPEPLAPSTRRLEGWGVGASSPRPPCRTHSSSPALARLTACVTRTSEDGCETDRRRISQSHVALVLAIGGSLAPVIADSIRGPFVRHSRVFRATRRVLSRGSEGRSERRLRHGAQSKPRHEDPAQAADRRPQGVPQGERTSGLAEGSGMLVRWGPSRLPLGSRSRKLMGAVREETKKETQRDGEG